MYKQNSLQNIQALQQLLLRFQYHPTEYINALQNN